MIFASQTDEQELLTRYKSVLGVDEVGRGAIAGPVAVGVVLLDGTENDPPAFLADSKMLSASKREKLVEPIERWALASAVGFSRADEIDEVGIVAALRLAALRAIVDVQLAGFTVDCVLLDGTHNWLESDLLCDPLLGKGPLPSLHHAEIVTKVRADAHCCVVAAASIIAKVARDKLMASLDDTRYQWAKNKGYASQAHILGLKEFGVSDHHRRSWKLPGISE